MYGDPPAPITEIVRRLADYVDVPILRLVEPPMKEFAIVVLET